MENQWNNGIVDESPNAQRVHKFIHLWESFERLVQELDSSMDKILCSFGKQDVDVHLRMDYKISMKVEEMSERARRLVQYCSKDKARFVESKLKIRDEKWNYLRFVLEERAKYFLERDKEIETRTLKRSLQRSANRTSTEDTYRFTVSKRRTSTPNRETHVLLTQGPVLSFIGSKVDDFSARVNGNEESPKRNVGRRQERDDRTFSDPSIDSSFVPKSRTEEMIISDSVIDSTVVSKSSKQVRLADYRNHTEEEDTTLQEEINKKQEDTSLDKESKALHLPRQDVDESDSAVQSNLLETNLDEELDEVDGGQSSPSVLADDDKKGITTVEMDSHPDSVVVSQILELESDKDLQDILNYQDDGKLEETAAKQIDDSENDSREQRIDVCPDGKNPQQVGDNMVLSLPLSDARPFNGLDAVQNNSLNEKLEDIKYCKSDVKPNINPYIDENKRDHNQNVVGIDIDEDEDPEHRLRSGKRKQVSEVKKNGKKKISVLVPRECRHLRKCIPTKKVRKEDKTTALMECIKEEVNKFKRWQDDKRKEINAILVTKIIKVSLGQNGNTGTTLFEKLDHELEEKWEVLKNVTDKVRGLAETLPHAEREAIEAWLRNLSKSQHNLSQLLEKKRRLYSTSSA